MDKKTLNEGLEYKDLVGFMKPTVHIDEFVSKLDDDDEIIVVSFYVKGSRIADDLIGWFEKGYEWVLDADRSPGEIKSNRFLVYVEIPRRTRFVDQLEQMLDDLETLTEFTLDDWKINYEGKDYAFDKEILRKILPLSPRAYRELKEGPLNEMRSIAGLPAKSINKGKDKDLDLIRQQAGLL